MAMAFWPFSLARFSPSSSFHPRLYGHASSSASQNYHASLPQHDLSVATFDYRSSHSHCSTRYRSEANFRGQLAVAATGSLEVTGVAADKHRPLAHFPPDMWGDLFDNFTQEDKLKMEGYEEEIEPLKNEVRKMLMDKPAYLPKKMSLIDAVERLGFPYYFQNEIKELLDEIFQELAENNFEMDYNLHDTALFFRILRQHGYNMPCDIFNKFVNGEGKFKESLRSDEKGMLSLYEASHLRVHEEDILEEALHFTTDFLKSIVASSEQARLALRQPLYRRNQRLQSRHFISFYEEDVDSRNEKLLQLAKIEFNRLQLLHCKELSQMLKWRKNLDFAKKLPHIRQRSVECHYLSTNVYYEPQYSFARTLLARFYFLLAVLDDIYDAYGTFEELQCLTDAFERWDLSLMEQFSADYMKIVYKFVISTIDDVAKEMTRRGKPYAVIIAKEQLLKLIRNYMVEVKWVESKYEPTFEEYMVNGRNTAAIQLLWIISLMGMEEVVEAKPYIQLMQNHEVLLACNNIARLMDDIATGEAEVARGVHLATSVECYMRDYNKSKEEVMIIFKKILDNAWKDIVKEGLLINPSPNDYNHFSKPVFDRILNLARAVEAFYLNGDGFTFVKSTIKEDILATYAQPFSI